MRNLLDRSLCTRFFTAFTLVAAASTPLAAGALAQEPETAKEIAAPAVVRSDLEAALTPLCEPLARRVVVRNDDNLYDVLLIAKLDFEKAAEVFRQAISTKRTLANGLRIERWTWIEPDRSYVLDIVGGEKPYRVRLTRHLAGAMLELDNVGAARDAPRWAPPYRPRPVLLPHGTSR